MKGNKIQLESETATSVETEKLLPSAVMPANDPGASDKQEIKLGFGEVEVASLDENGKEVNTFKVSISTFTRYFQDEKRFRLKKTFQS